MRRNTCACGGRKAQAAKRCSDCERYPIKRNAPRAKRAVMYVHTPFRPPFDVWRV